MSVEGLPCGHAGAIPAAWVTVTVAVCSRCGGTALTVTRALQTDESSVTLGSTAIHHFGPFDTAHDVLRHAMDELAKEGLLLPWLAV